MSERLSSKGADDRGNDRPGILRARAHSRDESPPASSARFEVAREAVPGIVANSPVMRALIELASRVATVDSTVLLVGESGVGKERIARFVHAHSPRASQAFTAVNCGALTETLLESELFGHARGAFTGASQDHAGLFEAANGGTLLLDEVGEISAAVQVKLLRALQEREVRRVGEIRSRPIDVRLIAATNRNLADAVEAGTFRQDLYYRLRVVELCVPPLRDRREDILPLAHMLLAEAATRMKRGLDNSFGSEIAELLLRYDWPGNVRELGNAMERAAALARNDELVVEDLAADIRAPAAASIAALQAREVRPLEEIEREYILAALSQNRGNQRATAQQLQIGSATLYRKLKRFNKRGSPGA